jgi:ubiquitin carboxyl-terminal hydrolase 4/11/15
MQEIIQPQLTPKKAKVITVHDCIAIFTASKEYTESDNWYCQHCNQIAPGKRTCKLRELPDVLIIHLKRFTSPRNKINYHVVFPIRGLDMSKYMAVSDAEGRAPVYDLFAVCNHAGRMASGHYTAYTKRPSSNGQEEWYIFDDTYVGKIDEKEVVNPNAYILFYMRRSKTKSSA